MAVNGRDQAALEAVVAGIGSRAGQAIGVRMREEVERQLGRTDVLIAFAGGAENPSPPTSSPRTGDGR